MSFKKGDLVECINATDSLYPDGWELSLGQTYTVLYTLGNMVYLYDDVNAITRGFYEWRFKLVSKVGVEYEILI